MSKLELLRGKNFSGHQVRQKRDSRRLSLEIYNFRLKGVGDLTPRFEKMTK